MIKCNNYPLALLHTVFGGRPSAALQDIPPIHRICTATCSFNGETLYNAQPCASCLHEKAMHFPNALNNVIPKWPNVDLS